MYQFKIRAVGQWNPVLSAQPGYISVSDRSGRRAINVVWGGTIERSIAGFIRGARTCRLPIEAIAAPGGEWQRLSEYQYVQGCLLFLAGQPQPVVFAVVEKDIPRVLMEAR